MGRGDEGEALLLLSRLAHQPEEGLSHTMRAKGMGGSPRSRRGMLAAAPAVGLARAGEQREQRALAAGSPLPFEPCGGLKVTEDRQAEKAKRMRAGAGPWAGLSRWDAGGFGGAEQMFNRLRLILSEPWAISSPSKMGVGGR